LSNEIVFTVKSGADCCSGVSLTPEQLNAMAETVVNNIQIEHKTEEI
jgi:hypothetical protein